MEALIAAMSSGITALIGLLVWWVKDRTENRQALALLKANKMSLGQRLINHKYVHKQVMEIRVRFNAHAVLLSKFHNGDYYSDGKHIAKWSAILQDGDNEMAEQFQNRLTRNSILFFGDLKEDDILICPDTEQMPCIGMKSLLKSQGIQSLVAAMSEESFIMVVFKEPTPLKNEDARWLLHELSSFIQYV